MAGGTEGVLRAGGGTAELKAAATPPFPCSPGYKYPRKHRAPRGHAGSSTPAAPAPAVRPGHPLALLGASGVTWQGMAQHSTAKQGTAWESMARHGKAWHGMAQHGKAQRSTAWHGMTRHGSAQRAQHRGDSTSILPSAEHTADSQRRAEPISRALTRAAHQAAACRLHPGTAWVQSAPAANPALQHRVLCLAPPGVQPPHSRAVGWQAGRVPHCPHALLPHMAAGRQTWGRVLRSGSSCAESRDARCGHTGPGVGQPHSPSRT